MSSTEEQKSLEQTPTWAVATVCTVFVVASLLVERGINALGRVSDINFTRNLRACYPLLHRPWPTYIWRSFILFTIIAFCQYRSRVSMDGSIGGRTVLHGSQSCVTSRIFVFWFIGSPIEAWIISASYYCLPPSLPWPNYSAKGYKPRDPRPGQARVERTITDRFWLPLDCVHAPWPQPYHGRFLLATPCSHSRTSIVLLPWMATLDYSQWGG
jgi:hypothetical protein